MDCSRESKHLLKKIKDYAKDLGIEVPENINSRSKEFCEFLIDESWREFDCDRAKNEFGHLSLKDLRTVAKEDLGVKVKKNESRKKLCTRLRPLAMKAILKDDQSRVKRTDEFISLQSQDAHNQRQRYRRMILDLLLVDLRELVFKSSEFIPRSQVKNLVDRTFKKRLMLPVTEEMIERAQTELSSHFKDASSLEDALVITKSLAE